MHSFRKRVPLVEDFVYEAIHFRRGLQTEEIADAILVRVEHSGILSKIGILSGQGQGDDVK